MLACGSLLAVAPTARAQVADSLPQRELEYRAAFADYEAALAAWRATDARSGRLLDQVAVARRQGGDAYEAAQRAWLAQVPEMERMDRRVDDAKARLAKAREAFLVALDARRDVLEARLLAAAPTERNELRALILDLENQYGEVEAAPDAFVATPVFTPVELSPRDGPFEIRMKADLLEHKAGDLQTQIDELDQDIERLEKRLRLDRRFRDFQAGVGRFDADRVPVGPVTRGRSGQDDVTTADSGVALEDLPLPERIEQMKAIRAQIERYRNDWLAKARSFRERVGRGGT